MSEPAAIDDPELARVNRMFIWRLAVWRAALYVAWICISTFRQATEPRLPFPTLSAWDQFMVVMGAVSNALPMVLAFLDKTSSRLEHAQFGGMVPKGKEVIMTLAMAILAVVFLLAQR